MELLIEETVEPSFVHPPVRKPAQRAAQPSFLKRLEKSRTGRAVLGFAQWGVVCGLVLTGFFGAELVSTGIDLASQSNVAAGPIDTPQPVLASADLNPRH
jgi:hypothetical protein